MKGGRNYHRKRPLILPPLSNLGTSTLCPMDPLQPPDLLLTKNRLGSPAPRRVSIETEDIFTTNVKKPIITISEPCLKEAEKCGLETDLLLDVIFNEQDHLSREIKGTNFFTRCEMNMKNNGNKQLGDNFPEKQQFKYVCHGSEKKFKSREILPLNVTEAPKAFESKVLQIPNRYKLLKPIGQKAEN